MANTSLSNPLLGELKFEKKNKPQPRLPPNTTIQRRPLNHAPIASPYAGASVQKVVYVSRSTPLMAAVKRAKKLLTHIEKRAMQDVDITRGKEGLKKLAAASEALGTNGEEVVVRASGRAIEQALKVGEWFKSKEGELACKVEVRTGSLQVVDDLVEAQGDEDDVIEEVADCAETDVEFSNEGAAVISEDPQEATAPKTPPQEEGSERKMEQKGKKRRKRGKRKRTMYDKDDMPEARIRWINTVEVAISLKG